MNCHIKYNHKILSSDLIGDDGRSYTGDFHQIVKNTKESYRTLSLDVEHNRSYQIGFINTDTLRYDENGIYATIVYEEGYDESNFKGLSPVLACDVDMKIQLITAIGLTDTPNFRTLSYKELRMEEELKQLKAENEKLLSALVEHRNTARTSKINEMIAKDKNLELFRGDLMKRSDEDFESAYSAVASEEVKVIEQDNSRQDRDLDSVSQSILEQLGVK